jgi:hypothetical protein
MPLTRDSTWWFSLMRPIMSFDDELTVSVAQALPRVGGSGSVMNRIRRQVILLK